MRQKQGLIFIALCMLFVLSHAYTFFLGHLNEDQFLHAEVSQLKLELGQSQFQVALKNSEISEMKLAVARALPSLEISKDQKYAARNIASLVVEPSVARQKLDLSDGAFAEAQEAFKRREFKKAAAAFRKFSESYPFHERATESYYLQVESEYLAGDHKKTLGLVKFMMQQFPENPLTGYSLLRMGQVLEARGRKIDANQIYDSVLNTYKEPKLLVEAGDLKKRLSL